MSYTFADLTTPETVATIRARIVANLIAAGVPVNSWPPSSTGGVENLRLDMVAGSLAALSATRIAQAVNGRVLPLAVAAAAAETTPGAATLLLKKLGLDFYKLPFRDATSTIQNVALYLKPGASVNYTFGPGDLWVRADSTGNRYQLISSGQIGPSNAWPNAPLVLGPSDNPLMLQFQAENPGSAYADPAGTILTMVTAKAGVQCMNVAPADFTPSRSTGGSSGTVTGKFTVPGVAPTYPSVRVQITSPGEIGTAVFRYSTDGGNTWINGGVVPASVAIPGGTTLTFANGNAPSFITGDILTIFRGDPIQQRGSDAETPVAFGNRCRNRWPALSAVPTSGAIDLWAHQASDEVDRVWSQADPNTAGGILVTIASSTGPASPQAQIAVEDYIAARLNGFVGVVGSQETVQVSTATSRIIQPAGFVMVPRSKVAAIQVASNVAWDAYLKGVPLGGRRGAVVRAAALEDILADAGVTNVKNISINGSADLTLNAGEVAVMGFGATLLTALVWVPV